MRGNPELFVLHPSVAVRWWLSDQHHEKAELLLMKMRNGAARVVVVDGIESHIAQGISDGLRYGLRLANQYNTVIESDVSAEIEGLELQQCLLRFPQSGLQIEALRVAQRIGIRITDYDAMCAVLALALQKDLNIPLLIADEDLRNTLIAIPRVRVLWLGNY